MGSRSLVDRLESRCLLSAGDGSDDGAGSRLDAASIPLAAVQPALVAAAAPVSRSLNAIGAIADELTGTFVGTIRQKLTYNTFVYSVQLVVTEVTPTGIVGSLAIGSHFFGTLGATGTFPGKLGPKGRFSFRFREDGRRVSIKGKIVPQNDRLVGKIRFKGSRQDVGGPFKMDKVAPQPAT